jgi:hypothetical protein
MPASMKSGLSGTSGASAALSAPDEEWEKIAEKTRTDYLNRFR